MTYKEVMELLKEIQDDCRERVMCNGCKFHTLEGCALQHIPDQWNLERIYTFSKPEPDPRRGISLEDVEEFYEALEKGDFNNGKQ